MVIMPVKVMNTGMRICLKCRKIKQVRSREVLFLNASQIAVILSKTRPYNYLRLFGSEDARTSEKHTSCINYEKLLCQPLSTTIHHSSCLDMDFAEYMCHNTSTSPYTSRPGPANKCVHPDRYYATAHHRLVIHA